MAKASQVFAGIKVSTEEFMKALDEAKRSSADTLDSLERRMSTGPHVMKCVRCSGVVNRRSDGATVHAYNGMIGCKG